MLIRRRGPQNIAVVVHSTGFLPSKGGGSVEEKIKLVLALIQLILALAELIRILITL